MKHSEEYLEALKKYSFNPEATEYICLQMVEYFKVYYHEGATNAKIDYYKDYAEQLQRENENLRATIKNDDVAVNNLCKEIENLKQQLKDKDEKISKVKEYCIIEREDINGSKCDDILEILESNKED